MLPVVSRGSFPSPMTVAIQCCLNEACRVAHTYLYEAGAQCEATGSFATPMDKNRHVMRTRSDVGGGCLSSMDEWARVLARLGPRIA